MLKGLSVAAVVSKHGRHTLWRYCYALWAMGRPLFLLGSLPLYLLGVAAARHDGNAIQPSMLVLGLLLVWLVQLMTHYNNEYCDLETDLLTQVPTHISGGSRVLVQGLVPRRVARWAAVGSLSLAVALLILLASVFGAGMGAVALVAAALLAGWFYSSAPLRLVCRGWGEVTIVLVTSFLLPNTAYYLQTSAFSSSLLWACVPLTLLTFAFTLTTELPDAAADRATGKMTLVARVGTTRAVWMQGAFFVVGWLSWVAVMTQLWPEWGWAAMTPGAPLAAASLLAARAAIQGQISAMQRMGLMESLMLGYATLALSMVFLVG